MKIKVTRSIIREAKKLGRLTSDPASLAIYYSTGFPGFTYVSTRESIEIDEPDEDGRMGILSVKAPRSVIRAVKRHRAGKSVKPFSFYIPKKNEKVNHYWSVGL